MTGKPATKPGKKPLRLPFRLKVPERDELIAYALATLAVGLMIGLAIGPMVSGSANLLPVIFPSPAVSETETGTNETVASVPALGSPAGSGSAGGGDQGGGGPTLVSDPAPETVEMEPAEPGPVDRSSPNRQPAGKETDPPPEDPAPDPEGTFLTGTVLANSPGSRTYWLNADGELTTVFAATVPDPGLVISTRVMPLSNGTLAESAQRSAVDISKESVLKAVVSYVDPVARVAVLSGRGASLPVFAAGEGVLDGYEVGNRVEATLTLNVPDPENFNDAEVAPDLEELPIQLGKLRRISADAPVEMTGDLVAVDERNGTLTLTADSTGSLSSAIDLQTPEGFPFEMVTAGRRYSVTATWTDEGLRIVGLSAASGKAAANDPARAFGTHAR